MEAYRATRKTQLSELSYIIQAIRCKYFLMADQLHKIGRQYLDLEFHGSETDAMTLQGTLSDVCMRHIAPAVERVLDRFSNRDELLRIDRLEIDAGTVGLDKLERMLPGMVADALEKALGEIPVGTEAPELQGDIPIRRMNEEENAMEALLCFLKNGTLPWSFRPASPSAFETLLLKALDKPAKTGEHPGGNATAMLHALSRPVARKRLVAQFSTSFLESVLGRVMPGTGELLNGIVERLRLSGILPDALSKVEDALREHAFACAASGRRVTEEDFLKEIETLDLLFPQTGTAKKKLTGKSGPDKTENSNRERTEPDKPGKLQIVLPGVEQADETGIQSNLASDAPEQDIDRTKNNGDVPSISDHLPEARPNAPSRDEFSSSETLNPPQGDRSAVSSDATGMPSESGTETPEYSRNALQEEHPEQLSGLYVDHAGLVLLHPFLPQFFRALGIAGDKKLLMPDRALQLLHFLATGKEQAAEYELVFPKILCGLPTGALVGKPEGLTPEEREEAFALLSAVVRHWDALKNTGQDGLRETYIKRPGKISRRDGDWLLQVESKSYDILLDRLPWGISMVQLPWMTRMIRVEWSY
jgi:hypothetical protein